MNRNITMLVVLILVLIAVALKLGLKDYGHEFATVINDPRVVLEAPKNLPDKRQFIDKLRLGNYAELSVELADYQQQFETGKFSDYGIYHVFSSFYNTDPNLQPLLEKWVETEGDSFIPHLALGRHYASMGWLLRGTGLKMDITESGLQEMMDYFSAARHEFLQAVELNEKVLPAYIQLLDLYMATGDTQRLNETYQVAKKLFPTSFILHSTYFYALHPKWGADSDAIDDALENLRPRYSVNPALRSLEGFPAYIQADYQYMRSKAGKRCSPSLEGFNKALEYGDHFFYYKRRGDNHRCVGNHTKAVEDYQKALALRPQSVSALAGLGRAYYWKRDYQKSIQVLSEALDMDRYNINALRNRGMTYYAMKSGKASVKDFTDILAIKAQDKEAIRYIAYNYFDNLEDYEKAEQYLNTILTYDSLDISTLYMLTYAQKSNGNCEYPKTQKKYTEACHGDGSCKQVFGKWIAKIKSIPAPSCGS